MEFEIYQFCTGYYLQFDFLHTYYYLTSVKKDFANFKFLFNTVVASIILILNFLSFSLSIKVNAFNLIKPYLFLVVRASDNVQGITKVAPLRASLHLWEYFSKNVKFVQTSTRILDPSS